MTGKEALMHKLVQCPFSGMTPFHFCPCPCGLVFFFAREDSRLYSLCCFFLRTATVVVVNLASRPPQFLGSASSAPEGLGSQYGANLVRDYEIPLTKVPYLSSSVPNTTLCADQEHWHGVCVCVWSYSGPEVLLFRWGQSCA